MKKMLIVIFLLFWPGSPALAGGTVEQEVLWEIYAPAGSDIDFEAERVIYFGTEKEPVLITSSKYQLRLTAGEVEYDKKKEIFHARKKVTFEGEYRKESLMDLNARGEELLYLVKEEKLVFPAGGEFYLKEDEKKETRLKANWLVLSLQKGLAHSFEAAGGFILTRDGWRLSGESMVGNMAEGALSATGNINFQYQEITGEAERLTFIENQNELRLTGNPVIHRGDDSFEGAELIYNVKTGRIKAAGPVKARMRQ